MNIQRLENLYNNLIIEFKKGLNLVSKIVLKSANVLYIGWVGNHNLGDEILYEAHIKLFEKFSIVHFKISKFLVLYSKINKQKSFICGILGGGTLINSSRWWLKEVIYIQNKGIPVFCFGTGVTLDNSQTEEKDKYNIKISNEWYEVLKKFDFIGVRGPYSKVKLIELGLKNVVIIGDTVLSLAKDTYIKKSEINRIGINIGLNKYYEDPTKNERYLYELILLIRSLIKQGYYIDLLPAWEKDVMINKKVCNVINDNKCQLKICFSSLSNYTSEIEKCNLFIGQKLHSTIIACMNRIPSIMIEYDYKCRDFMASIDMEKYTIGIEDFNFKEINKKIKEIINDYEYIQSNINKNIIHYKKIQYFYADKIMKKFISKL